LPFCCLHHFIHLLLVGCSPLSVFSPELSVVFCLSGRLGGYTSPVVLFSAAVSSAAHCSGCCHPIIRYYLPALAAGCCPIFISACSLCGHLLSAFLVGFRPVHLDHRISFFYLTCSMIGILERCRCKAGAAKYRSVVITNVFSVET